ncbi:hypothetical protein Taro_042235 [Colocasia esculenta]|uniref:C2H2-type domain-containing protein n=1 Tax=Colocasia esculenta TaxID=4460 RepID=A0A843WZ51_COLES|nr:hypothetical protein [Colocasia esculenta]
MKRFREGGEGEMDTVNLAEVLVLLSRGGSGFSVEEVDLQRPQHHPGRVFECKTCNRRFPSFQALGGHRASHKKPRLDLQQAAAGRPRVHECSICGLEFAIGQALGGHMRRHRAGAAAAVEAFQHAPAEKKGGTGGEKEGVLCLDLDLNLSPSEHDLLSLGLGLPVVVDCFH